MDDISNVYSIPQGELDFTDEDIAILKTRFLHNNELLSVYPVSKRSRLMMQLEQMISTAKLEPDNQIPRLLRYPIFRIYALALLGYSPELFVAFLNLPEPLQPSFEEERAWTNYKCWNVLQTTVCNFSRCTDSKNKEYIEYQIICEIETQNEETKGIENAWAIPKRYSDFLKLQQQLKKLDSKELGSIPFPGKTFLPGRATSQPVIQQRQAGLDEFLSKVIEWIKKRTIILEELPSKDNDSILYETISLLDEFLEISQLDRKAPWKACTAFSCNTLSPGWFRSLLNDKNLDSFYYGYNTINCEVLSFLLQGNKNIKNVDLSGSAGGSLRNDGFRSLLHVLSTNNCGLSNLYLGRYQGHNCDNEDIETFFSGNLSLNSLFITGGISLSVDDPLLGLAIRIPSITTLDLSGCFTSQPKAAQAILNIVPHLKTHKNIKELYLNGNHIGNRGAELLSEAIIENDSLSILSLRGCSIGPSGLISLSEAISSCENLERVFITDKPSSIASGQPSSTSVCEKFAEMIQSNQSLIELDISRQYLGESSIKIIEALENNSTLQILHMRNNRFIASKLLEKFFIVNKSITSLDISHNDLVDENTSDTISWKEQLEEDQMLQKLSLPWLDKSNITKELLESIAKNKCIKWLEFSNPIQDINDISNLFTENNTIEIIENLESPPKGLYIIHSIILSKPSLRRLHWVNMDPMELKKITQEFQKLDKSINTLHFSFTVTTPQNQLEHLTTLSEILPTK